MQAAGATPLKAPSRGATRFGRLGNVYLTVDNILDQAHVVSRRPYGVRPGKPRLAILGYKYQF